MIREVQLDWSTYNDIPWKFEAGTPNIGGAIGLGAAIDYLDAVGMGEVRAHEERITAKALAALRDIEGLEVFGPEVRGGVVSFAMRGAHPHDIATILDQDGVEIRAGHHCAQPLMRRLNVVATARASFYIYNTESEIEVLVESLKKVKEVFARVS